MTPDPQLDLFSAKRPPDSSEVEWLVRTLTDRDWLTAEQLLKEFGLPATDSRKRRLRTLANRSKGRVGSGQCGYKLIAQMTATEYAHFNNWMASQESEMKLRRIEAARVWHSINPATRLSE